jgi:hypothetical protein
METYGQKSRLVNGKEYQDSKFASYNNLMEIMDFKVLAKGCETWIKGHKYPVRGCFNSKTSVVHGYKKLAPILLKSLEGNIFKKFIGLVYLKLNWKKYLEFVYLGMRDVYTEPDRYSQPVREIYRLIKDEQTREVVCAILEFDDAYRYRVQDILGELNKANFRLDPMDEIKRLVRVYVHREDKTMGRVFNAIRYGLSYLKLNRKLLVKLKDFVEDLDLDEIKMSKEDIYWTNILGSYKYRGLSLEDRRKL